MAMAIAPLAAAAFTPALSGGIATLFGMAAATTLTNVLAGAIIGAATSALMGGDPLTGALFGGLGGAASGMFGGGEAVAGAEAAVPAEVAMGANAPLGVPGVESSLTMPGGNVIPASAPADVMTETVGKGVDMGADTQLGNKYKADIQAQATGAPTEASTFGAPEPTDDIFGAHFGDNEGGLFSGDIFGEGGLLSAKNIGSGLSSMAKTEAWMDAQELKNEGAMDLQTQAQQNKWAGITPASRPAWLAQLVSTNPRAVELSQVYTGHPGYETQYAAA